MKDLGCAEKWIDGCRRGSVSPLSCAGFKAALSVWDDAVVLDYIGVTGLEQTLRHDVQLLTFDGRDVTTLSAHRRRQLGVRDDEDGSALTGFYLWFCSGECDAKGAPRKLPDVVAVY